MLISIEAEFLNEGKASGAWGFYKKGKIGKIVNLKQQHPIHLS